MPTMHERHLEQANRHVAEAEARVTRQRALIDGLAWDGHDTAMAEKLLQTMLTVLDTWRAHQAHILAEVAAERDKPPSP